MHEYIRGPMKTLSLHKSNYFIIFLDDFSGRTWVYFIKEKYDAFVIFQQFKVVVENKVVIL